MKAIYIQPQVEVIALDMEELIAQSTGAATVGGEAFGEEGFSKRRDFWGE